MATTLQLTDGTLTLDLNDGTTYQLLQDWAPVVSRKKRDVLANQEPYQKIVEQIPIRVFGANKAAVFTALGQLSQLLTQAIDWAEGGPGAQVYLVYQPDGGTTQVRATVWGPANPDASYGLRPDFQQTLKSSEAYIMLEIVRSGAWLDTTLDAQNGVSGNLDEVLQCSMTGAISLSAPTVLTARLGVNQGGLTTAGGIVWADGSGSIRSEIAKDFSGTGWSIQTDAGNYPPTGGVLRMTSSDTDWKTASRTLSTALDAGRYMVLASVRNNSTTASWAIRVRIKTGLNELESSTSRAISVDSSYNNPRLMVLGVVSTRLSATHMELEAKCDDATSETLDVSHITLVKLTENSGLVTWPDSNYNGTFNRIEINHLAESELSPRLGLTFGTTLQGIPAWQGSAFPVTQEAVVEVRVFAYDASGYWTLDDGLGAKMTATLYADRMEAHLAPPG